jgi:hypothetical protein
MITYGEQTRVTVMGKNIGKKINQYVKNMYVIIHTYFLFQHGLEPWTFGS